MNSYSGITYLWYYIFEYKKRRFCAIHYINFVKSSSDQKIIDFRDKVHAVKSDFLEGIDRSQLTIWEEGATNKIVLMKKQIL
jgi:hypothetical protein